MKPYKFLKKLIPSHIKDKIKRALIKLLGYEDGGLLGEHASVAYSQEGEDRILYSFFDILNKKNGFYVDVGAHHPKKFSNTYLFYLQGWRGINVDANADVLPLFREIRPNDINISIGVGEKAEKLTFYVFNEPALNTFDAIVALSAANTSSHKIIDERVVEVIPLSQILDIYLPKGQEIDFLSIDVEGRDLDVLKSNDWSRYSPLCILAEHYIGFDRKKDFYFYEVLNSEITQYLQSKGYSVFAKRSEERRVGKECRSR